MEQMTIQKPKNENRDLENVLLQFETERCCNQISTYEITYEYITRKWFVCNQCLELDFFKTNIKEKVRIQS